MANGIQPSPTPVSDTTVHRAHGTASIGSYSGAWSRDAGKQPISFDQYHGPVPRSDIMPSISSLLEAASDPSKPVSGSLETSAALFKISDTVLITDTPAISFTFARPYNRPLGPVPATPSSTKISAESAVLQSEDSMSSSERHDFMRPKNKAAEWATPRASSKGFRTAFNSLNDTLHEAFPHIASTATAEPISLDAQGSTSFNLVADPPSTNPRQLLRSSMRNNNSLQPGSTFSAKKNTGSVPDIFGRGSSMSSKSSQSQASTASSWTCLKCDKIYRSLAPGNNKKHLRACTGKCSRCRDKGIPCEKFGGFRCKACKDAGIESKGCDNGRNRKRLVVEDEEDTGLMDIS